LSSSAESRRAAESRAMRAKAESDARALRGRQERRPSARRRRCARRGSSRWDELTVEAAAGDVSRSAKRRGRHAQRSRCSAARREISRRAAPEMTRSTFLTASSSSSATSTSTRSRKSRRSPSERRPRPPGRRHRRARVQLTELIDTKLNIVSRDASARSSQRIQEKFGGERRHVPQALRRRQGRGPPHAPRQGSRDPTAQKVETDETDLLESASRSSPSPRARSPAPSASCPAARRP
jgi:hypothetical protein